MEDWGSRVPVAVARMLYVREHAFNAACLLVYIYTCMLCALGHCLEHCSVPYTQTGTLSWAVMYTIVGMSNAICRYLCRNTDSHAHRCQCPDASAFGEFASTCSVLLVFRVLL